MARAVGGRQKLELCLDDEQSLARWKVEVFPHDGHLYLHQGWKHFAHALELQDGFSLVVQYDGRSHINVTVFDLTTYRKQYLHDFKAGGSQLSLPIVKLWSLAVILKKYHLKEKYLVSTRARCRTYQCRKLLVSSFSSIVFVRGEEHASGLRVCAWLRAATHHRATDGWVVLVRGLG